LIWAELPTIYQTLVNAFSVQNLVVVDDTSFDKFKPWVESCDLLTVFNLYSTHVVRLAAAALDTPHWITLFDAFSESYLNLYTFWVSVAVLVHPWEWSSALL
jgi:hypothetical protein